MRYVIKRVWNSSFLIANSEIFVSFHFFALKYLNARSTKFRYDCIKWKFWINFIILSSHFIIIENAHDECWMLKRLLRNLNEFWICDEKRAWHHEKKTTTSLHQLYHLFQLSIYHDIDDDRKFSFNFIIL